MAIGGDYVLNRGFIANEALTQYRFVKLVTANDRDVDQCDTQGELALGVGQDTVAAGDAGSRVTTVALLGVSVVEAGAAITKFAEVTPGADGRAETAAAGDRVVGIALDDASGAGDWISVLLVPAGRVV